MTRTITTALMTCLLALSGCNLIYKQNIQQGNAIEQDKLDQLELGMTMTQVAYLLGTPAIRDPFHQSRWDYLYTMSIRGRDPTSRQVTLSFDNAVLIKMSGVSDEKDALVYQPESEASSDEPLIGTVLGPGISGQPAVDAASAFAPPSAVATYDDVLPLTPNSAWVIHMGEFSSLEEARDLVNRLRNAGFDSVIFGESDATGSERLLVRSPAFANREDAERRLQQINQAFRIDAYLLPPEF